MRHLLIITAAACLLLGAAPKASAQRYLPRQVGLQLTAGPVDGFLFRNKDGARLFHSGFALSRYNENRSRWVVGADYLHKEYRYRTDIIPVSQFTAEGGYFIPFLSTRGRDLVLSVGVSALAGYEEANWGNNHLTDGSTLLSEGCFIYGVVPALELETFLADRVVLLLNVRQRVLFGSDIGHFHTVLGFGLKFIIN